MSLSIELVKIIEILWLEKLVEVEQFETSYRFIAKATRFRLGDIFNKIC